MRMRLILLAALPALLAIGPAQAQSQVQSQGPTPPDGSHDYPVCTHPGQDSCQNPGEGGASGRSRAADYPGGPAAYGGSAMDHPMMDHSAMMSHAMPHHRMHHQTHRQVRHHPMHPHHQN